MHEELLQKIEKECEIRNLSPRTCFIYKFHTTKFLDWAGDKPISELSLYEFSLARYLLPLTDLELYLLSELEPNVLQGK